MFVLFLKLVALVFLVGLCGCADSLDFQDKEVYDVLKVRVDNSRNFVAKPWQAENDEVMGDILRKQWDALSKEYSELIGVTELFGATLNQGLVGLYGLAEKPEFNEVIFFCGDSQYVYAINEEDNEFINSFSEDFIHLTLPLRLDLVDKNAERFLEECQGYLEVAFAKNGSAVSNKIGVIRLEQEVR